MENVNSDQVQLELKAAFKEKGLERYFCLPLGVFKESQEVLDSIRAAAKRLRELGFEAGVIVDTDEGYHQYFLRNSERGIYLSDSGNSSVVHSRDQDRMAKTADMLSSEEEELVAHFVDLQKAREKVYCNIMDEEKLVLFPDFQVGWFRGERLNPREFMMRGSRKK